MKDLSVRSVRTVRFAGHARHDPFCRFSSVLSSAPPAPVLPAVRSAGRSVAGTGASSQRPLLTMLGLASAGLNWKEVVFRGVSARRCVDRKIGVRHAVRRTPFSEAVAARFARFGSPGEPKEVVEGFAPLARVPDDRVSCCVFCCTRRRDS